MASNNCAEVITDVVHAQKVLADLNQLAAQGQPFKMFKFNLDTDRFGISGGRESNFPILDVVEESGTAIDGLTLLSKLGKGAQAIDFGNGHVGLFYESDRLGYMAIPSCGNDLKNMEPAQKELIPAHERNKRSYGT